MADSISSPMMVYLCAGLECFLALWLWSIHNEDDKPFDYELGSLGLFIAIFLFVAAGLKTYVAAQETARNEWYLVIGLSIVLCIIFTFTCVIITEKKKFKKIYGFWFVDFLLVLTEVSVCYMAFALRKDACNNVLLTTNDPSQQGQFGAANQQGGGGYGGAPTYGNYCGPPGPPGPQAFGTGGGPMPPNWA